METFNVKTNGGSHILFCLFMCCQYVNMGFTLREETLESSIFITPTCKLSPSCVFNPHSRNNIISSHFFYICIFQVQRSQHGVTRHESSLPVSCSDLIFLLPFLYYFILNNDCNHLSHYYFGSCEVMNGIN